MKLLKYFFCILFLCGAVMTVPSGCGPGKTEKIDPSDYDQQIDEEGEADYDDGRGENVGGGGGGERDYGG